MAERGITRAVPSPFGPPPLRGDVLHGLRPLRRTTILDTRVQTPTETNNKGPAWGPLLFGGEGGITRAVPSPFGSPSLRDDDLRRLRRLVEPPF